MSSSHDNWRRLPPISTISPPPKRHKSESPPLSDSGLSRYYVSHSGSVPSSDRASSRHASAAMDIYAITDRDPSERDRARDREWERQRERERERERERLRRRERDRELRDRDRERERNRELQRDYDARRAARFASNGSVASHTSAVSRGSHSSPPIVVAERKVSDYKAPADSTEKYPLQEENGRKYHGYHKNKYFLPCDEEEQDRLDIFHKLFTVARAKDGLIYAPHTDGSRILDLGCGTGIWCIDVASKLKNSHVVGVDLAAIQPTECPKNLDFYSPFDFDGQWSLGEDSWDLIHMQMGCGSVVSWPTLYKRAFRHLRPGAWFEQVEIDFEPRCDDRDLSSTAMRQWYKLLKKTTEANNRPIAHDYRQTIADLQAAGFTQIDHQVIGLPMNPWHDDDHERQVARWYNLAISESVETLCLAPFTRTEPAWDLASIRRLAHNVKTEAFNREIRCYNILHIYQAQKPFPN
ncbi:hypothetical protein N7470_009239 [Penicillium chermesinum]|nr:hypothetical protein N7470_009239 [Penicillium chermesinum]